MLNYNGVFGYCIASIFENFCVLNILWFKILDMRPCVIVLCIVCILYNFLILYLKMKYLS